MNFQKRTVALACCWNCGYRFESRCSHKDAENRTVEPHDICDEFWNEDEDILSVAGLE